MFMIKSYIDADWDGMRELIMEMWNEEYSYNALCYELLDPYYYKRTFLSDDHHIFIAKDEKGVCGFIIVSKGNKALEVVIVCVSHRKRREGVSLALMKQVEAYGRMDNYDKIVIHSIVANNRSHDLKKKLGYTNKMTAYISTKILSKGD